MWARAEAIAREEVREEGGEVHFGTYYQKPNYAFTEDHSAMPESAPRD